METSMSVQHATVIWEVFFHLKMSVVWYFNTVVICKPVYMLFAYNAHNNPLMHADSEYVTF